MSAIRETLSLKVRKGSRVRFTLPRILVTAAAGFLALTAAAGTASAATGGAQPGFAAQARGYGLSSTQVSTLQREVNSYIAQHGGKQTAINQVAFPGGGIVFTVPGQKYARPVTSAATARPATAADCPHLRFCIYESPNFVGKQADFEVCNKWQGNSSGYHGSWKNDQTPGLHAWLKIRNNTTGKIGYDKTCNAWCEDSDWSSNVPILEVHACTD